MVALCALLGARLLGGGDASVDVWAARAALHEGQQVTAADLVARQVRFADQADADRYLSAGGDLPTGATLDRAVGAGELLPRAALGRSAPGSLTDVPLSVSTEAVPATVHVGSVVDVWVTPDNVAPRAGGSLVGPRAPRSTLVFHDVSVVSAPGASTSLGPAATRQVIVGVGADQTAGLSRSIAALSSGTAILTVQRMSRDGAQVSTSVLVAAAGRR